MMRRSRALIAFWPLCALAIGPSAAFAETLAPVSPIADVSARHIVTTLFQAAPGVQVDFSGRHLAYLDLSQVDFKGANLARSNLYGTDFTSANLSGANLSDTKLDRAVLIRANLSGANLSGATIYRPTIYTDLTPNLADAPRFKGANLRNIKVQAELSGSDFSGADLTGADFSPLEERAGEGTLSTMFRNVLKSCDFSGARLENANMYRAMLWFSRFNGADLRNVNFTDADLSNTDFSGADVSGANFAGADLYGANFKGARGMDKAIGLDSAKNRQHAKM